MTREIGETMATNEEMQQVHDFLEECVKASGSFYLVTVDGDKPACRPVSFHMLVDGKEYFGVGTFKNVFKQITANPNVQVVGCKGANWIRMSGTAVVDDDPALFAKAVETMPFLANLYNEKTGNKLGIFRLENGEAQFVEKMMDVTKTVEI